ncbi:MAG: hypothetical protein GYB37_16080 [Algicola sp.]|nr:hypothetical protein [Algicola sp.]
MSKTTLVLDIGFFLYRVEYNDGNWTSNVERKSINEIEGMAYWWINAVGHNI